MKLRVLQVSAACVALACLAFVFAANGTGQEPAAKSRKVVKSDAEWRKLLTREQYYVTRQAGTEAAFSGKLWNNHAKGIYECVCCETELFNSKTKFESGTGWPSFYNSVDKRNIDAHPDADGSGRIEVLCNVCGAHLGHVFDDGPPPTGLRFCMNSASLKFVKESAAKAATKAKEEKATKKEGGEKAETDAKNTDKAEKIEKKEMPAKDAPSAETPR